MQTWLRMSCIPLTAAAIATVSAAMTDMRLLGPVAQAAADSTAEAQSSPCERQTWPDYDAECLQEIAANSGTAAPDRVLLAPAPAR